MCVLNATQYMMKIQRSISPAGYDAALVEGRLIMTVLGLSTC